MNLARTQTLFTAALKADSIGLRSKAAAKMIVDTGRIQPELALRIYRNNVVGARVKALMTAYPACVRILGADCFAAIAGNFSAAFPSTQQDLNRYGAQLAVFLGDWVRTHQQFSDYRYLKDLAHLEWLCHEAFYAHDDPPFDFGTLARAAERGPESIRLKLGSSVGVLRSSYPVMEIREINLADDAAASAVAGNSGEQLVVWRASYQALVARTDEPTFQLLAAVRAGCTLERIIEGMGADASLLCETVPRLIKRGWISGVTVASADHAAESIDARPQVA